MPCTTELCLPAVPLVVWCRAALVGLLAVTAVLLMDTGELRRVGRVSCGSCGGEAQPHKHTTLLVVRHGRRPGAPASACLCCCSQHLPLL